MKKVTATKTFRPRNRHGEVIHRGTVLDLEDDYAQQLIRTDMAVGGDKSLKDYQNKMQAEYQDKGFATTTETPEQRTQGMMSGTRDSETPEERTQGYGQPVIDADKEKRVEVVPATGPAQLDPKRKSFLEDESKRITRERDEAERKRLGRFERIKVADTVEEAESQEASDRRKVGRGHEEKDKEKDKDGPRTDAGKAADKDQRNRGLPIAMFAEIIVVVPPEEEPVTVAQLKGHARIVDPPDPAEVVKQDALLASQITAARERCEGFTRCALISQTIDVWYDSWDGPGVIEYLPRPPVQSVLSVTCYDNGNQPAIVNDAIYTLAGRTLLFMDWIPYFRPVKGIKLTLKVGYGEAPESVPGPLRSGILEYATMLYEHRMGEPYEAEYAGAASAAEAAGAVPPTVYDLWRPFQIIMVLTVTYKASDLREWIEILQLVKVPDGGGGSTSQWLPFSPPARVPAMVHPRTSRERFMGGQTASTEQILVVIRYLKGLKGEMRIKYGTRTLLVLGTVDVEERHTWLEIETEEQYGE